MHTHAHGNARVYAHLRNRCGSPVGSLQSRDTASLCVNCLTVSVSPTFSCGSTGRIPSGKGGAHLHAPSGCGAGVAGRAPARAACGFLASPRGRRRPCPCPAAWMGSAECEGPRWARLEPLPLSSGIATSATQSVPEFCCLGPIS